MFEHPTGRVPSKVVIVGCGPSRRDYLDILASENPHALEKDEVWGVNNAANFTHVDVTFAMDDFALVNAAGLPLRKLHVDAEHPVITSVPRPECPTAVGYPLGEVLAMPGARAYLNHTAAYMLAYAALIGVKEVVIFGADYISSEQYNTHLTGAEQQRLNARYLACMSFWAGFCAGRGVEVLVTPNSPLLDECRTDREKFYGYLIPPRITRT